MMTGHACPGSHVVCSPLCPLLGINHLKSIFSGTIQPSEARRARRARMGRPPPQGPPIATLTVPQATSSSAFSAPPAASGSMRPRGTLPAPRVPQARMARRRNREAARAHLPAITCPERVLVPISRARRAPTQALARLSALCATRAIFPRRLPQVAIKAVRRANTRWREASPVSAALRVSIPWQRRQAVHSAQPEPTRLLALPPARCA